MPEHCENNLAHNILADALLEDGAASSLENRLSNDSQEGLDARFSAIRNMKQCIALLERANFEQKSVSVTNGISVTASGIHHLDCPLFMWDPQERQEAPNLAQLPYRVKIENNSEESVKLVARKWLISNLVDPEPFIVQGEGVIGKTPTIEPAETFGYSSSTLCKGHTNMRGAYTLVGSKGPFDVEIPLFSVWNATSGD